MNVGKVESGTLDRRTCHSALATLPQWKLHGSCRVPSLRTYDGGGGSTHSYNLLNEELSKFVGVDGIVEADTGLCHMTRLMKMNDRQSRTFIDDTIRYDSGV